jgi:hypothetical protein
MTAGVRNASQIFSNVAGGTDHTSIWSVQWHPDKCHLFYPRHQKGGYDKVDAGLEYVDAITGTGQYRAWRTQHKWEMGLAIPDYRGVSRLCNIDVSSIESEVVAEVASLRRNIIKLIESHETDSGNQVLYMNRRMKTNLMIMATSNVGGANLNAGPNLQITPMDYFGVQVDSIMGVPIRIAQRILDTEAEVT